jgi:hypothetical protein
MSPSEAQIALYFLSRVAPRGTEEERELIQVIHALNSLANPRKNSYNDRNATAA